MKNPMTSSGIEPATFRFVAQHFNHCATRNAPLLTRNLPYTTLKAIPLQWSGPQSSRKLMFPDFMTTAQKMVRLSALRTGRIYHQEILLVLISVRG